ncbi:MAG: ribosome maturation factor RimM [Zoogloeaceae bacterium]|jgi:16S rRNA processing protein RimM|nr:ribosome maturation factor RimM [Zoogloeaceae bacterium]
MTDDSKLLILGRVRAAYGVKGWVKAQTFGDDAASWRKISVWRLAATENGPWRQREAEECKAQGKDLLIRFADVTDRAGAESLQGCWLAAPRDALPPTDANEFYWDDLIGLKVLNNAGASLGQVAGCIASSAHTVLRVLDDDGETERLLPFVGAVVHEVDLAAGRMRVDWEADW